MSQLTYGVPPVGAPGLRLPGGFSISRANGNAANPCPYGRAVQFKSGDEDNSVVALSGASDALAGIVVFEPDIDRTVNQSVISGDTNGTYGPNVGESMTLERRGAIWVEVETTVVSGDKPFVRYATNGGNTMIGVFANTAGTGRRDLTNLGQFILGGGAGALALLAFDFDGATTVPAAGSVVGSMLSAALLADIVDDCEFVVGALTSHAIAVTLQMEDPNDANTAQKFFTAWLSDTAGGLPSGTAADGGITVTGTGAGIVKTDTTGLVLRGVTGTSGSAVITPTHSTAHTYILNVEVDGKVYSSPSLVYT